MKNKIINADIETAESLLNIIERKITAQSNRDFNLFKNRFDLASQLEYYTALKFKLKGCKVQFASKGDIEKDIIINDKNVEIKFQHLKSNNTLKFKLQTYSKKTKGYINKGFMNGSENDYWFHYFKDQNDEYYLLRLTKKHIREIYNINKDFVYEYCLNTDYSYKALSINVDYFKKYYSSQITKLDI